MASKKPQKQIKKPMVSSISSKIKNTVFEPSSHASIVSSTEDTIKRKQNFLSILDKATEKFLSNLEADKIDITSTIDLERIIKLTLLTSGEADTISGKAGTETTSQSTSELPIEKLDQILSLEDPLVKEMYDKLFDAYNKMNDKEE